MNNSELLFYAEKHQHNGIFLFSNKKKIYNNNGFNIIYVFVVQNMNTFYKYEHQNTSFKYTLFILRRTKVFIYCDETSLIYYMYIYINVRKCSMDLFYYCFVRIGRRSS